MATWPTDALLPVSAAGDIGVRSASSAATGFGVVLVWAVAINADSDLLARASLDVVPREVVRVAIEEEANWAGERGVS